MTERALQLAWPALLALAAYWTLVPRRLRPSALFAGSFAVLAWANALHAGFLLALSLLGWAAVRWKRGRIVAVVLVVGCLAVERGLGPSMPLLAVAGFSYANFKLLSALLDSLRDETEAPPALDRFLAWIFFLPTFFAGPIARVATFAPRDELTGNDLIQGTRRLLAGLAKKAVIVTWLDANGAAWSPDVLLGLERNQTAFALLLVSIRIYADFSAYTDLAIGAGRLLGVGVPENFHWPYLTTNIVRFWQSWHVTLSEWIRDYIFMPLSRFLLTKPLSTRPTLAAVLAYLVAFTLCGAWHGLEPHFLAWGAYHGALLGGHRAWTDHWARRRDHPIHRWRKNIFFELAACAITFVLVSAGWTLFVFDLHGARAVLVHVFRA